MKCQSTSLYVCVRGSWMSYVVHIYSTELRGDKCTNNSLRWLQKKTLTHIHCGSYRLWGIISAQVQSMDSFTWSSADSSQTMTTLYMTLLYSKLANAVNECACLTVFVSSVMNRKLILGVAPKSKKVISMHFRVYAHNWECCSMYARPLVSSVMTYQQRCAPAHRMFYWRA